MLKTLYFQFPAELDDTLNHRIREILRKTMPSFYIPAAFFDEVLRPGVFHIGVITLDDERKSSLLNAIRQALHELSEAYGFEYQEFDSYIPTAKED